MGASGGVVEAVKPVVAMVVVQVVFAGVNIFYKLAVCDGMDMRVLVAYRYLFATAFLGPLAFFVESWVQSKPPVGKVKEEPDKVDEESSNRIFLMRPIGGFFSAEPLYLQSEAHLGDLRVGHDQPHPGHHLRPRSLVQIREAGDTRGDGAGEGDGHGPGRRRRDAADVLQGRGDHPLDQPRRPRARRRGEPPRVEQPAYGLAARHHQLLLLRSLAHTSGEAEQGVPVSLLEHGVDVPDEHGTVRGGGVLFQHRLGSVAARLKHQAPLSTLLGRTGFGGDAGGAVVVREEARAAVRFSVQPPHARRRRGARLTAARREVASRKCAGSRADRDGAVRGAVGERPRGGQGRRVAGQRRRPHRRRCSPCYLRRRRRETRECRPPSRQHGPIRR